VEQVVKISSALKKMELKGSVEMDLEVKLVMPRR